MKKLKKTRTGLLVILLFMVTFWGAGAGGGSEVSAAQQVITKAKAKSIVLKDAGFRKSQIRKYKVKLEGKKNKKEYEIEFVKGDYRYEYELNAYTGKIKDIDIGP